MNTLIEQKKGKLYRFPKDVVRYLCTYLTFSDYKTAINSLLFANCDGIQSITIMFLWKEIPIKKKECYDNGYRAGKLDGEDMGYMLGHEAGHEEGFDVGHEDGWMAGHDDGWEVGFDNGYDGGREFGWREGWDACEDACKETVVN